MQDSPLPFIIPRPDPRIIPAPLPIGQLPPNEEEHVATISLRHCSIVLSADARHAAIFACISAAFL